MADCLHFSLRFNYEKSEHRKVIDALEDIDKTKYASKTHFIICALEHYIDWIALDDTTRWSIEKERENMNAVSKKELEDAIESLKASIKADLYEKMFQYMSGSVQVGNVKQVNEDLYGPKDQNKADKSPADIAEDLSQYSGVMESVLSWSED